MSRTHCDHCNALVTPGAPFCLACFLPFEDEPATAVAQAPVPAGVGAPAPAAPPTAPAAGGDFYYAAPAYTHPGQAVDWRVSAPGAAMLMPSARSPRSRTPRVVLCVVGVLALVGMVVGAKALLTSPSDKETIATAFREARPPDFIPTFPDLTSFAGVDEAPEGPGDAKAFVEAIDPQVREGNDALLAMQQTLDRWADGKVGDDQLRNDVKALQRSLNRVVSIELVMGAPSSTQRGLAKLRESVTEYTIALGALLDWLDSRSNGSRLTYRLSIGGANVHWDEGLINLYRAAGMRAPTLPHPQRKG